MSLFTCKIGGLARRGNLAGASRPGLLGTFAVLALKVPCPRKLLSPEQTGVSGHLKPSTLPPFFSATLHTAASILLESAVISPLLHLPHSQGTCPSICLPRQSCSQGPWAPLWVGGL